MKDELLTQYDLDLPTEPANPTVSGFDPIPGSSKTPMPALSTISSRFVPLNADSEAEQAKASIVSLNTRKNTGWAVNVWKDWSTHKSQIKQPLYS